MIDQTLSIKEICALVLEKNISKEQIDKLREDTRSTVVRLVKKWDKEQAELERVQNLYYNEYQFLKNGYDVIAGVDEAGRGPLAGPVVVAAVILPLGFHIPKINDSKKLSAKLREEIYHNIIQNAIAIERAVISQETIDKINIYQSTVQGMYEVIDHLNPRPKAVFIDAVPLDKLTMPSLSLIKGDAISASIAAASIIAKVERDKIMDELDHAYPMYGFSQHKGYGTKQHIEAIGKYGPCPVHRKSFEPIKSWRN
ncbi:ribonuclease HII [Anaerosinus massiliensis]|uniref:ribonuclease HII n=1 Tax=Massilibacillus massiliensis TaxID=1806837 RepID=UPI000DA61839|nr:ribonuclease HII [Massilibacillus massiliensis]